MIVSCKWWMRYFLPWRRAMNSGSVGGFMYPLSHMVRYWSLYPIWKVICMTPLPHWFSDPPYVLFKLFQFFSKEWCSHEKTFFKWCICWKRWFLKLDVLFCLCLQILLNNVLYDVVCMINKDAILNLYNIDM